jgi:hypothetical protein
VKADQRILIYRSPNGDAWFLCHEHKSGHAFVKHHANPASGGTETDIEVDDFLAMGPRHPQHEALLRLMADGAVPVPKLRRRNRPTGTKPFAR